MLLKTWVGCRNSDDSTMWIYWLWGSCDRLILNMGIPIHGKDGFILRRDYSVLLVLLSFKLISDLFFILYHGPSLWDPKAMMMRISFGLWANCTRPVITVAEDTCPVPSYLPHEPTSCNTVTPNNDKSAVGHTDLPLSFVHAFEIPPDDFNDRQIHIFSSTTLLERRCNCIYSSNIV